MAPLKRGFRSEEGAELIEFAIVLPVLMLIVCGIFDFGFCFQRYEVLTNAAREGARMAAMPGYTADQVTGRVNAYLSAAGVTGSTVTPPLYEMATAGTMTFSTVKVSVTYTHQFTIVGPIMSLFSSALGSVPLKATVVMRVESQGGG